MGKQMGLGADPRRLAECKDYNLDVELIRSAAGEFINEETWDEMSKVSTSWVKITPTLISGTEWEGSKVAGVQLSLTNGDSTLDLPDITSDFTANSNIAVIDKDPALVPSGSTMGPYFGTYHGRDQDYGGFASMTKKSQGEISLQLLTFSGSAEFGLPFYVPVSGNMDCLLYGQNFPSAATQGLTVAEGGSPLPSECTGKSCDVASTPCVNYVKIAACTSGSTGDPHLHFAHGGTADFRGRSGTYYNFFSAPGLAVNVKTEDATFTLHGGELTVDGSFITEAHVVARVGGAKRKELLASFWASELNDDNWGWRIVNGTCAGHVFQLGKGGFRKCEELAIDVDMASAAFAVRNWTITVRGNHVYDRIAGPKHRIDLSFSARATDAPRPTAPRPGLSVHPSPPPLRRPARRRRARCRTASSASRTRRRRHAAARRTRTRGPATSSRAPLLRAPSRGAPPCTRSRRPTPRNTPSRASTAPRRRRPWTSSRPAATRRHRTRRGSSFPAPVPVPVPVRCR